MRFKHDSLLKFCVEAMRKCGMSQADAETSAEVLVTTDLMGVHTHGSKQLHLLLKNMREGGLDAKGIPEVISEGPAWGLIDGNFAMPMVTSTKAMKLAIEKSKSSGIALVAVRRSSHFGAAGYYANMAAKKDMIGIAMSNVDPCMAVPGSKVPVLGTNPIAYAAPLANGKTVFLDIATSVSAVSKVYAAKALGKSVPDNWLIDKDGLPTNDPSGYPQEGAILPMAGHKGYGIALLIEILSAVLTGACFTQDVKCWLRELSTPVNQGHAFIAVDVSTFIPTGAFKERMDKMACQIRSAPKAKGADRIYLPGEMEWEHYAKALDEGIDLPEDVENSLTALANELDIDIDAFL